MKNHYSTESGELLQLFIDLAVQIKQVNRFTGGCLVVEGEVNTDSEIDVYWKHQDGTIQAL